MGDRLPAFSKLRNARSKTAQNAHHAAGGIARRADVAALAGVSATTVSLVLNDFPDSRISAATRERVLTAAAKLGYTPSCLARALVSGQTRIIGAVLHFLKTPFIGYSSGVLNGVWQRLREHNYRLLIDEGSSEHLTSTFVREKCVDGLLIFAPPANAPLAEFNALARMRFPAVLVGATVNGAPLDYVDLDNRDAGERATAALIAAGHRRILHISGPLATSSAAQERLAGYGQALKAAGIAFDQSLIIEGDYLAASGEAAINKALANHLSFTAVFAANAAMAYGSITALRRHGFDMPDDISVIGIDSVEEFALTGLRLTTISQPLAEIGAMAADVLLARIRSRESPPIMRLLPGIFMKGETIGPLAQRRSGKTQRRTK